MSKVKCGIVIGGGGCWHVSMHILTTEISINLKLSKAKISIEFMMEKNVCLPWVIYLSSDNKISSAVLEREKHDDILST